MDFEKIKKYYSQKSIQERLLFFSKHREIGVFFEGRYFGKRVFELEYLNDIRHLVEKWATSFHMGEERWLSPQLLGSEKTREDRDKNRLGWDLVLDLDGIDFEYSKIAGEEIISHLSKIGVRNISAKFSGNRGFHVAVPFEAFSPSIVGVGETKNLFPEIARKIATYLTLETKRDIARRILKREGSIENISEKSSVPLYELVIKDKQTFNLNVLKCVEIDTILISSRHLIRMPYSFHEKSGLISIPVNPLKISDFKREEAKIENVDPLNYKNHEFLNYHSKYGKDGDSLLLKCEELDDRRYEEVVKNVSKRKKFEESGKIEYTNSLFGNFLEITQNIKREHFPNTIKYVLENKFKDGRKRALFLLLTFLYSIKYEKKVVEELVSKWNNLQETPLRKEYVEAQFQWFNNKEDAISPPNFDNPNYYENIGIPKEIIQKDKSAASGRKIRNPLHYCLLVAQKKSKK